MSPANPMKFVVGGVAAVAIALGAYAIGNSNSGNGSSGTASAAQTGQAGQPPGGGHLPILLPDVKRGTPFGQLP